MAPEQEARLEVREEVLYSVETFAEAALLGFVTHDAQRHVDNGTASADDIAALKGMLAWLRGINLLRKIEDGKFSEADMALWDKAVPEEVAALATALFETRRKTAVAQALVAKVCGARERRGHGLLVLSAPECSAMPR